MIDAYRFLDAALDRGHGFYTGVPCSFLTPFINATIGSDKLDYVAAASEGEAVGIAAGAWLAGKPAVAMCQNSGLGNMVNPLTSLNHPLRVPVLLIVTWRGEPGLGDEPQHEVMGEITAGLLDTIRIPHSSFPEDDAEIENALGAAQTAMDDSGLPFAFIMRKGSVAPVELDATETAPRPTPEVQDFRKGETARRVDALECLHAAFARDPMIATTGKTGRELFTLGDRENQLYLVGSMGCASGVGLGVARTAKRRTVVLDGDGAALMKLGTMATIGAYAEQNLVHVLLDNGVHDSTGGQGTVSGRIDFAGIAAACGYGTASRCDGPQSLGDALAAIEGEAGPHFLHVRIEPGSIKNLGRPTVPPDEVARRFRTFVTGG